MAERRINQYARITKGIVPIAQASTDIGRQFVEASQRGQSEIRQMEEQSREVPSLPMIKDRTASTLIRSRPVGSMGPPSYHEYMGITRKRRNYLSKKLAEDIVSRWNAKQQGTTQRVHNTIGRTLERNLSEVHQYATWVANASHIARDLIHGNINGNVNNEANRKWKAIQQEYNSYLREDEDTLFTAPNANPYHGMNSAWGTIQNEIMQMPNQLPTRINQPRMIELKVMIMVLELISDALKEKYLAFWTRNSNLCRVKQLGKHRNVMEMILPKMKDEINLVYLPEAGGVETWLGQVCLESMQEAFQVAQQYVARLSEDDPALLPAAREYGRLYMKYINFLLEDIDVRQSYQIADPDEVSAKIDLAAGIKNSLPAELQQYGLKGIEIQSLQDTLYQLGRVPCVESALPSAATSAATSATTSAATSAATSVETANQRMARLLEEQKKKQAARNKATKPMPTYDPHPTLASANVAEIKRIQAEKNAKRNADFQARKAERLAKQAAENAQNASQRAAEQAAREEQQRQQRAQENVAKQALIKRQQDEKEWTVLRDRIITELTARGKLNESVISSSNEIRTKEKEIQDLMSEFRVKSNTLGKGVQKEEMEKRIRTTLERMKKKGGRRTRRKTRRLRTLKLSR